MGDLIVFNKTGEWCFLIGEKIPACGPLLNGEIIWDVQWGGLSTDTHDAQRHLLAGLDGGITDWNLNYFFSDSARREGTTVYVGQ